jgi:CRISPR system Cascade subunit CasD
MDILILRLRGPLMAFGDVAVDEIRPTDLLPGLSFMTGLLGNALGWMYIHGDRLQALQDRLRLAARLERPGEPLRDYQTAYINKNKDMLWRSRGSPLKRTNKSDGESIVQRERFYRADAAVTAALSLEPPDASPSVDDIENALRRPARPLFLGRVNCPPSGPLYRGERVQADSLEDALRAASPQQGAQVPPWLTECPAEDLSARRDIRERYDLRDWKNGVHAGSRFVRRFLPEREDRP